MRDRRYKLSPCPFCGNASAFSVHEGRFGYVVMCHKCGAESNGYATPEEAAAGWNRRTDNYLEKQIDLMAHYIVERGGVDINLCDEVPQDIHLKHQPKNDGDYDNAPCIECIKEHFARLASETPQGGKA